MAASAWAGSDTPNGNVVGGHDDAKDRGSIVYQRYCANRHGVSADGKGRVSKLYAPKPANLQTSQANDAYKELIIRRRGAHVGRSEIMPPWGEEPTDAETLDVVAYLRTVLIK